MLFLRLFPPAPFLARAILLILCKLSGGGVSSSSSSSCTSFSVRNKFTTGCRLKPLLSSAGCRSYPRPSWVFPYELLAAGLKSRPLALDDGWGLKLRPSFSGCKSNPRPPSVTPGDAATADNKSKPLACGDGCRLKPAASSTGCKSNPRPSSVYPLSAGAKSRPRCSPVPDTVPTRVPPSDDSTLDSMPALRSSFARTGFNPNPPSSFKELSFSSLGMTPPSLVETQSSVTTTGCRSKPRERVSPCWFFSMTICRSSGWSVLCFAASDDGRSKLPVNGLRVTRFRIKI